MAERENITDPSMGSNELGEETGEIRGKGVSAGSDTQLHIAALSSKNKKEHQVNKTKEERDQVNFPEADETDE